MIKRSTNGETVAGAMPATHNAGGSLAAQRIAPGAVHPAASPPKAPAKLAMLEKVDDLKDAEHTRDAAPAADAPPVAMVDQGATAIGSAFDAAGMGTDASAQAPQSETVDAGAEEGGVSPLVLGGLLLAGAGLAAVAAGGGGGGGGGHTNSAPTFSSATQAVTTAEDTKLTVTAKATDADGDALTYTAGAAGKGTVSGGEGGVFSYNPNADFNGADSFVVTARDASGATTTQTINVTVSAVNDAPAVAATQTVAANEDVAKAVTVAGTDVDGDTLTYAVTTAGSQGGTLTGGTGGAFTYTSAANFSGAETFTVTVKDPGGLTATQTITVNVAAVNDAPTVAATQTVSATEDTAKTVTVAGTDVDGDSLTYIASAGSQGGALTGGTGGVFTYSPAANFNGAETFTVTVNDAGGLSATQTITVNVAAVNDAPTIDANTTTEIVTAEDTSHAFFILASDVDTADDDLSVSVSKQPLHGKFDKVGEDDVYVPDANFNGVDSFDIKVSDGQGGSVIYTVNVTVTPVNDAPVFSTGAASASVAENAATGTVIYDAAATDVEGSTLTYSLGGADAGAFTIDADTGEVRLKASADFEAKATYHVDVLASDGALSGTQALTVNVTNVNEAPVFTSTGAVAVNENIATSVVVYDADVSDPDGDSAAFSLTGADKDAFTIDTATGEVRFVASPDYEAQDSYSFNVVAKDAGGLEATRAVTLTVNNQADVVNLDTTDDDGKSHTPFTFDADGADYQFDESGAKANSTILVNFSDDDFILTDSSSSSYAFTSNGDDLVITRNIGGIVSEIVLQDVVPLGAGLIQDEQDAEDALGWDFFRSSAPADPAQTLDLDLDPDLSPLTVQQFDAGGISATFAENGAVGNTVSIINFSSNDRILVSNAAPGDYSFTSSDNDLIIDFTGPGGPNHIVIEDIVSPSAFINSLGTAEAAVGFNFFQFA